MCNRKENRMSSVYVCVNTSYYMAQSLWQHRPHNSCYVIYIFLADQWGGGLLNTLWQSSANVIQRHTKHMNSITQSELLYKHTKIYNSPSARALVLLSRDKVVKAGVMCASDKRSEFLTFGLPHWIVLVAENLASHKCVDQNGKKCLQRHSASSGCSPLTSVQKDGTWMDENKYVDDLEVNGLCIHSFLIPESSVEAKTSLELAPPSTLYV